MPQPIYNYIFDVSATTDPVDRNKGVYLVNTHASAKGSAILGFFDLNGETAGVGGPNSGGDGYTGDGVAGITAEVQVPANSSVLIPIRVANTGAFSNCEVKGLN